MIQKKTSKETQDVGAKADNDDKKLKSKESEKKDKAENGKENNPVTKEKEAKIPEPLKESVNYNSEKNNLEKEVLQPGKVENPNMYLAPIAIVLSIIALLVSVMFAVSSKSVTPDGGTPVKQQLQLTGKLESSLVANMKFIYQKLGYIESKIAEFDLDEKTEREKRGIIELKKALLTFQEARSLINDNEILKKILKIEEDLKSTLVLPEGKETDDELTTQMDENPAPGEKEPEEIIVEPEIGNGEEREKTSETEIIEPTVNIAGSEGDKEDTATETKENETELQLSEME